MSKKEKQHAVEPAEDSIGLRMVSCGIALLCIITACVYVNTQQLLVFLYLWGALTGSYVSYQFRNTKTFWTIWITSAGLLIVLGHFVEEVIFQYMAGKIHPLVPFIHVLTGLQALHTFDLRAKSDINISALIGLGLFACTTVLSKDLNFAYITLTYISLGAALLYYESVSRTLRAGNLGTASGEPDLPVAQTQATQRQQTGSVVLALSTVPLLSLLIFFALPRVDSLIDMLIENARRAQAGEQLTFKWVKEPNGLGLLASQNATVESADGKPGGRGYSLVPGQNGGPGINLNQGDTSSGQSSQAGKKGGLVPGASGENGNGKGKGNGKGNGKGQSQVEASVLGKHPAPPAPPPPEKDLDEQDKQLIFHTNDSLAHDEDVILRVTSSQDTYLKRMCFDTYDGHKWTTSNPGKISKCSKAGGAFQELAGVPALFVLPQMHATEISQEITVEADIGRSIPATYVPQRMNFPQDPIMIDRFGAMHALKPLIKGTTYHVYSWVPDYDLESMRKVPLDEALQKKAALEFSPDLQLPKELSPAIVSLAKDKAGQGNWFARAERICNFLRSNYKYSLDEQPNNQEIAYDFLFQKKQGACGPFATSFIVMCRAIGIPAHCVGGFAPGDFNANTGSHDVRNKHGHAWAEVYVPGYDWVPFDATPGGLLPKPMEEDRSLLASIKKNLEALQVKFTPAPPPPPPIKEVKEGGTKIASATGAGNQQGEANSGQANRGGQTGTGKSVAPTGNSGQGGKGSPKEDNTAAKAPAPFSNPAQNLDWHTLVLIPIILPALMLFFQAMQAAYKQARNRVRKQVEKPKVSTLLFLKVTDDLKKLKINRLPSDTPEELLARFSEATQLSTKVPADLSPLCKRFMELYCADRFGCDDLSELRQQQLKSISEQIHELVRAIPSKN